MPAQLHCWFCLAAVQSAPDTMTAFAGVMTSMFTSYSTIPATGDRAISSDLQVAILDTAPVWMIGALQQLMIGRRLQISSRQCQRARFRYFRSRPVGADSALNGDNPQTQKRSYN